MTLDRARIISTSALYTLIALIGVIYIFDGFTPSQNSTFVTALLSSSVMLLGVALLIHMVLTMMWLRRRYHKPSGS